MLRSKTLVLAAVFVSGLLSGVLLAPASAGSLKLAWTTVPDPDVAGYKIYYGTSPGAYTQVVDVGNVDHYKISAIADCVRYYIAVKAYDTSGNLSSDFSNSVVGLPDPRVTSVSPSSAERGQSLTATINGSNFDSGVKLVFSDKITVYSTTYLSCTQGKGVIGIAGDALIQTDSATMSNLDGSRGTLATAFQVLPMTYPQVISINPAPGAGAVPITVRPTVTFSERMNPLMITTATVRLLAPDGTQVPQAAGSPSLEVTGKIATIVPAASLRTGTVYRLDIEGGVSGVRDAQGTPMLSTIIYSTGFTTAASLANEAPAVASASPSPDAMGVPLDVQPDVIFNKPIDPGTVSGDRILLVSSDGAPVEQAAGSPRLDPTGTIATIVPASALSCGARYSIKVLGGGDGVRDYQGQPLDAPFEQTPGFTTMAESSPAAPSVVSFSPADGASAVSVEVEPSVTFSEPVDPATITAANVRLLDPQGRLVNQAPGSPRLDRFAMVATITPFEPLRYDTTYRIQILGGVAGGVEDTTGTPMDDIAGQDSGFTTLPPVTSGPLMVVQTDPEDGDAGVPADVHPSVVFNKPIEVESITPDTILLVGSDGMLVPQADGSPVLEANARVITILPAETLQPGETYRIVVMAGDEGVEDASGTAMEQLFFQQQGFTVEPLDVEAPAVSSTLPVDGQGDVPTDIRPIVTFSQPLDPATVSVLTIILRDEDGAIVPQADGSPYLDETGRVVSIVPEEPLKRRAHYTIQVLGGPQGVAGAQGGTMGGTFTTPLGFETGRGDSDYGEDDGDRYE